MMLSKKKPPQRWVKIFDEKYYVNIFGSVHSGFWISTGHSRIPMPMSVAEYQIANLFTTIECAKSETGGGDGVEEITNEPFVDHDMGCFGTQSGQYTLKKFHLDHKTPAFVRLLTPKGSLHLQEESWSSYPYCRTVLTNDYLGERLVVTIESVHLSDRGGSENALGLSSDKLQQREVIFVDITQSQGGDDQACTSGTKINGLFSQKGERGPLEVNWHSNFEPVMTCYKLVTIDVRIFGLQGRLENFILNNQRRIFTAFHRRMFITMDQWFGLTVEELRVLESQAARELDQQRRNGELRGTMVGNVDD